MSDLTQANTAVERLVALSEWIDAGNAHRDPEAVSWGRIAKLTEEAGEVISAFIGATGQNPRKGVTNSMDEVLDELLDVAVTALGAYEHLDGHQGRSLDALERKVAAVADRAARAVEADTAAVEPAPSGLAPFTVLTLTGVGQAEVMRWDGSQESQAHVVTWGDGKISGWFSDHYYLEVRSAGQRAIAVSGDYIIKAPDGSLSVWGPEDFARHFVVSTP